MTRVDRTIATGAAPVSVIVPAHNAAATLAHTLDSVLAQTRPPLDILVVDDGSTDETAAIAARLAPRVRYLRRLRCGGPAAARNAGIAAARGEFLAFLDADDVWPPEHLAQLVASAQSTGAGLVFSDARVISPTRCWDSWLLRSGHDWLASRPRRLEHPLDLLVRHGSFLLPSAALVRHDLTVCVAGFDEDLPFGIEDFDFWLRLAPHGTWHFHPGSRIERHEADSNLSGNNLRMAQGAEVVWRKLLNLHPPELGPELFQLVQHNLEQARRERRYWARHERGLSLANFRNLVTSRRRNPASNRAEP